MENNQSFYFTEDNLHERASKTHLAQSTGCIRIILNTTSCGYSCDSLTRKAKKFVCHVAEHVWNSQDIRHQPTLGEDTTAIEYCHCSGRTARLTLILLGIPPHNSMLNIVSPIIRLKNLNAPKAMLLYDAAKNG